MPTVTFGPGKLLYLQVTNIDDRKIVLSPHTTLGMWMKDEITPRSQGYVLYGSCRYEEWQSLAYESTTEEHFPTFLEWMDPLRDVAYELTIDSTSYDGSFQHYSIDEDRETDHHRSTEIDCEGPSDQYQESYQQHPTHRYREVSID